MGLILDSSVLISAERRGDEIPKLLNSLEMALGDQDAAISVVTAAELLHGCWRTDTEERREQRFRFVDAVLEQFFVVPMDVPIARVAARVDAERAAAGETLPVKDLWIAATAISRGDEVVTGNVRDFRRVPDLTVHEWD